MPTMITDKNLHFIKNKMEDAGQAMVYRYIDETHKQALGLKTAITIDDEGKLYFVMQNEFEKNIAMTYFR